MATKIYFKIYLVALCIIVFTPQSNQSNQFFGIIEISDSIEKLLNLILLIPLSFFIFNLYPQLKNDTNILICFLTSTFIELVQFLIPGRFPDMMDLILNSLGPCFYVAAKRKGNSKDADYAKKIRKMRNVLKDDLRE